MAEMASSLAVAAVVVGVKAGVLCVVSHKACCPGQACPMASPPSPRALAGALLMTPKAVWRKAWRCPPLPPLMAHPAGC